MRGGARWISVLRLVVLVTILGAGGPGALTFAAPPGAGESGVSRAGLPEGFSESVVFSGLEVPTAVRFAADGRVFIAEKSGVIKVFASLDAPTPTIVVDLRDRVMDQYDRGLLGLALDPNFPATPDLYALYTHDAPIGGAAPVWGDACADAAAATTPGCVVSGRLSRFRLAGAGVAGPEQVIVEAWCQQFPSHSIGDLAFGPDGALYVSAGEGASFSGVDVGQYGVPANPCGDPFDPARGVQEGGALRAQDLRTDGDPLGYEGTVLRVDPANPGDQRVVAHGFRNPFRMTTRPGTGELWVGNVGWERAETINRIADPTDAAIENFGWPCYEGAARQPGYEAADLAICKALYAEPGAVTPPFFAYDHAAPVVPGDGCSGNGSSVTGLAFYGGGGYPTEYQGALFFGDYARGCIWVIRAGANGDPDPATVALFRGGAVGPIDLRVGPGGDLFYLDIFTGTLRRIRYLTPVATIQADRTSGPAPLKVTLDGRASTAPGGELAYAWDLNGDGVYGDATGPIVEYTYGAGSYTVGLRVTDNRGFTDTATIAIVAGALPGARITAPAPDATWRVGSAFTFAGAGIGTDGAPLPASALSWSLIINHCSSSVACHTHLLQRFDGVAGGSFVAPDHEYPSSLELRLTVRDPAGTVATTSVHLRPETVNLEVRSEPEGLSAAVNAGEETTPFFRSVIRGSANTLSPPAGGRVGDALFIGWIVDGNPAGWANPLVLTVTNDRVVKAAYGPLPRYDDVPWDERAHRAIIELGARGVIRGYGDGRFGPGDAIVRAQMAGLIARAMGWTGEAHANPFPDQGGVDGDLWRDVGALNHYGVARGFPDGTYNPTGAVLHAQTISFITRAMIAKGYWQPQPDDPALHPEVPASSGHRADIATYVHYAGAIPGFPREGGFPDWDDAATRAWFAEALWRALDGYFRVDRVE